MDCNMLMNKITEIVNTSVDFIPHILEMISIFVYFVKYIGKHIVLDTSNFTDTLIVFLLI